MTGSGSLLWGALAIGVVTGMRSMLAPTMVGAALAERSDIDGAGGPAERLAAPRTQRWLLPLAVGELLGDKMPFAPDRTIAPSLLARAVSGGFCAAALAGVRREPVLAPALIGATAACVSSVVAIRLRKRYGRSGEVANAALGLAEDCLALAIGNASLRRTLGKA
ncbi:DUF4126 domain-containing protein [Stutzerimonas tarimensis]|uniref:DUF4126 domain-containing protein n=1 Tax=Stutzerimonas tarimensis TaxID=1507735 RepID=A0ABV7T8Y6_9GAMM